MKKDKAKNKKQNQLKCLTGCSLKVINLLMEKIMKDQGLSLKQFKCFYTSGKFLESIPKEATNKITLISMNSNSTPNSNQVSLNIFEQLLNNEVKIEEEGKKTMSNCNLINESILNNDEAMFNMDINSLDFQDFIFLNQSTHLSSSSDILFQNYDVIDTPYSSISNLNLSLQNNEEYLEGMPILDFNLSYA